MGVRRWVVGLGALGVAGLALYFLTGKALTGNSGNDAPSGRVQPEASTNLPVDRSSGPVLDEIDEKSRDAMRDLLREAGED